MAKTGKLKRLLLLFLIATPLWAAMSDASAYKAAQMRWGAVWMVGQKRGISSTYWQKLVGYASPMCEDEFTVVGSGDNTWDAAFADADLHPVAIHGPYAGMLTISVASYDQTGTSSLSLYIDGVAVPPVLMPPVSEPSYTGSWTIDTRNWSEDNHVVCAQSVNAAGLLGKLNQGAIFSVSQATGQNGQMMAPGPDFPGLSDIGFSR